MTYSPLRVPGAYHGVLCCGVCVNYHQLFDSKHTRETISYILWFKPYLSPDLLARSSHGSVAHIRLLFVGNVMNRLLHHSSNRPLPPSPFPWWEICLSPSRIGSVFSGWITKPRAPPSRTGHFPVSPVYFISMCRLRFQILLYFKMIFNSKEKSDVDQKGVLLQVRLEKGIQSIMWLEIKVGCQF